MRAALREPGGNEQLSREKEDGTVKTELEHIEL